MLELDSDLDFEPCYCCSGEMIVPWLPGLALAGSACCHIRAPTLRLSMQRSAGSLRVRSHLFSTEQLGIQRPA